MRKTKIISLFVALALVMAVFAGCGSKGDENVDKTEAIQGEVLIAAAASLENAFVDELIPLFNEKYPDIEVSGTYDSSGKLQEQIEGGLDAAIFMSAATTQMDALVDGGYIDRANVVDKLENEVVLIKSKQSDTKATSFESIADADSIAIGDPASVPAGQYAEEILKNLKVWDKVSDGLSLGTNVTEVLSWVSEGSAEVGIVYKTDAESVADKIDIIETAPEKSLETPVIYPLGMLNNIAEENTDAAKAMFEFLQSDEALDIFEKYGFKIV